MEAVPLVRDLIDAVSRGDAAGVALVLSKRADPNHEIDAPAESPLSSAPLLVMAAIRGDADVVETLLRGGARVDATATTLIAPAIDVTAPDLYDDLDSFPRARGTALSYAAKGGKLDCVKALLAAKADVDGAGDEEPPIVLAAEGGHLPVVARLLEAGASLGSRGRDGRTVRDHAAAAGRLRVYRDLVERGAPGERKMDWNACLRVSARSCDLESVTEALAHGAKVDASAYDSDPALIEAVRAGSVDIVVALVAAGANVTARASDRLTALDEAVRRGHREIERLLRGASPRTRRRAARKRSGKG